MHVSKTNGLHSTIQHWIKQSSVSCEEPNISPRIPSCHEMASDHMYAISTTKTEPLPACYKSQPSTLQASTNSTLPRAQGTQN